VIHVTNAARRRLALLAATVALATPLAGQSATTESGITAADLRTRLSILADDSMMGRQAGFQGNYMATSYIGREVERLGLTPGGPDGTFFQEIPLRVYHLADDSHVSVGMDSLARWTDYAPMLPLGNLPIAEGGGLGPDPAVYAGRLGTDQLLSADSAAGKTLVFGPALGAEGPVFRFADVIRVLRTYRSASAIIMANLDYSSALVDFVRNPSPFLADGDRQTEGGRPLLLFVSDSAFRQVFGTVVDSVAVGTTGEALGGGYRYELVPPQAPARNVVAILPGQDSLLRNQYVVIGAHNDHVGMGRAVDHDSLRLYNTMVRPWGASTQNAEEPTDSQWTVLRASLDSVRKLRPPRIDSIFNGADDDGSGTVALLEIAEAMATNPTHPGRSVIFMFHTAEEAGLLGSQYFTDHPTVPRDSIVTALNMDMVGRGHPIDPDSTPKTIQIIGSRRLSTELGDVIEAVNEKDGHPFEFDYSFDANGHPQNRYCRSDHFMYARYGIPISYFSAGYHQDYHQQTDEAQYINYPHLAALASFLRDVVTTLANLDHRPVVDKPVPQLGSPCRQ